MTKNENEELVREHFLKKRYRVDTAPDGAGFAVDMFAQKGKLKLAIQCRIFDGAKGEITRQMIMELYGAKKYFDCQRAIIATDRMLEPSAALVADKLKIDIFLTNGLFRSTPKILTKVVDTSFEGIWKKYIIPLVGKTIARKGYKTSKILRVDESGVERLASLGKTAKIDTAIFRKVVNQLLTAGSVTKDELTTAYSAAIANEVILVLSRVFFFTLTRKPAGLKYIKFKKYQAG